MAKVFISCFHADLQAARDPQSALRASRGTAGPGTIAADHMERGTGLGIVVGLLDRVVETPSRLQEEVTVTGAGP